MRMSKLERFIIPPQGMFVQFENSLEKIPVERLSKTSLGILTSATTSIPSKNTSIFLSEKNQEKMVLHVSLDSKLDDLAFYQINQADLLKYNDLLNRIRKSQHIEICDKTDVEATERFTGFSKLSFVPKSIPSIKQNEVDTSTTWLGKKFDSPLMVTGMTGGIEEGQRINENLAEAAERFNIPMGVGSQRMALENSNYESIFQLKQKFPKLFLVGNLGLFHLKQEDAVPQCRKAIEMIEADALALHVNLLQEAVQPEGAIENENFFDLLKKIRDEIKNPLILKEVGVGLDAGTALKLQEIGFDGIDIGGSGGTSWAHIEGARHQQASFRTIGESFRDFGIPTAYSLAQVTAALSPSPLTTKMSISATGGIRSGIDVAKAVALGASTCGIGLPLFRAALKDSDHVGQQLSIYKKQLEILMLCTDSKKLDSLSQKIVSGRPGERFFDTFTQSLQNPNGRHK